MDEKPITIDELVEVGDALSGKNVLAKGIISGFSTYNSADGSSGIDVYVRSRRDGPYVHVTGDLENSLPSTLAKSVALLKALEKDGKVIEIKGVYTHSNSDPRIKADYLKYNNFLISFR